MFCIKLQQSMVSGDTFVFFFFFHFNRIACSYEEIKFKIYIKCPKFSVNRNSIFFNNYSCLEKKNKILLVWFHISGSKVLGYAPTYIKNFLQL